MFPYQLLAAYRSADAAVPAAVRDALQDAMELAIANVPAIDGQVYVCPDVSGSMHSPVTGHREGATTAVRCIDVAALVAAAILRRNPTAEVLPFEEAVVQLRLSAARQRDDERRAAGVGRRRRHELSAPLALLNAPRGEGRPGRDRLGQRVVGRRGSGRAARRRCASGSASARATRRRGWC